MIVALLKHSDYFLFCRSNIDVPESVIQENVVYSYVNPEDCKCECHEIAKKPEKQEETVHEDELPLLEDDVGDDSEKAPLPNIDRIKLDVTVLDRTSIVRFV